MFCSGNLICMNVCCSCVLNCSRSCFSSWQLCNVPKIITFPEYSKRKNLYKKGIIADAYIFWKNSLDSASCENLIRWSSSTLIISWQPSKNSLSILRRYFSAREARNSAPLIFSFCSIEDAILHDALREPEKILQAVWKRFLSSTVVATFSLATRITHFSISKKERKRWYEKMLINNVWDINNRQNILLSQQAWQYIHCRHETRLY